MRYLLSLMLAALATLSLAGCAGPYYRGYTVAQPSPGPHCMRWAQAGDTKIQNYCNRASPAKAQASSTTCRSVTRTGDDTIQTFCGTPAEWDAYDTWAFSAGVTCGWNPLAQKDAPRETCRTSDQWLALAREHAAKLNRGLASSGSFSGGSGVSSGGSGFGWATSYGAFPAGSAVGATW